METISDFFDAMYSHFLLRDIVAKVIPGLIVLAGISSFFFEPAKLVQPPWLFDNFILTLVVLYAAGLAAGQLIQYVGMFRDVTITHVWPEPGLPRDVKKSVRKAIDFHKIVPHAHSLIRKRERMIVLKEMQGNFGLSLGLFGILQAITGVLFEDLVHRLAFAATALILAFILARHSRALASEQRVWEEEAIDAFS